MVFDNVSFDPISIASNAFNAVSEFWEANGWLAPNVCCPVQENSPNWVPPDDGYWKANVVGAFSSSSDRAGIGVVFRDYAGNLLESSCAAVSASSAFMAEALALKKAMHMSLDMNLQLVTFESDCENLVRLVNKVGMTVDWRCEAVIDDISLLLQDLPLCKVSWVRRNANKVADWLASYALKGMCGFAWVDGPPSFFLSILDSDAAAIRSGIG